MISLLIQAIDGFEIGAREFDALVAKLVDAFIQVRAILPDEHAVLIPHPAPFAALLYAHFTLEILPAMAAIHAAGGRHIIFH
jgi:hypothetical protein